MEGPQESVIFNISVVIRATLPWKTPEKNPFLPPLTILVLPGLVLVPSGQSLILSSRGTLPPRVSMSLPWLFRRTSIIGGFFHPNPILTSS